MTTLFKIDARKALLTAAVAAAFMSANPLFHAQFFGGTAQASENLSRNDHDDHMTVRPSGETAQATKGVYVDPAIADDDMDGDNGLDDTDKKNESHDCNGRACR